MNVLITGASSGIGLAVSKHFISKGHTVYGIAHTDLTEKVDMNFYKVDITNYQDVDIVIEQILNKAKNIDILLNCAGYGISGTVEDTKLDVLKQNFEVNYFAMVNIVSKLIPNMRDNKGGKIAFISSVASILPIPFQTYYSSVKAAINLYSEGLNLEVKPFNITTTTFLPGDVRTNFTKNRRKNTIDNPSYKNRVTRSVSTMEKDEQNGLTTEYVAKVIYKNLTKKRPPLRKVVGKKYKFFVFLYRLLSIKSVNKILGKIYG